MNVRGQISSYTVNNIKINTKRGVLNIILFVLTLLLFILYHNFSKNPYANVPRFEPIKFNEGDQCYKSYAFQNEESLKYKINTIKDLEFELYEDEKRKIFFHKTDCIHDGVMELSARQACAVESAAVNNPEANIFLMYAAEVGWTNTSRLPYIDALLSYSNIKIISLDVEKEIVSYVAESPLNDWIDQRQMFSSPYIRTHMNDILRAATLFNFGGTVIDLDALVVKNLQSLGENYAAMGTTELVYCGVLNLGMDEVGREVSTNLMKEFISYYSPKYFGSNGHWYVMRVLQDRCGCAEKELKNLVANTERCRGFNIYPKPYFYGLNWVNYLTAFEPVNSDIVADFNSVVKDAYIIHFEATLSSDKKVVLNSGCGYERLARQFCPRVYSQIRDDF